MTHRSPGCGGWMTNLLIDHHRSVAFERSAVDRLTSRWSGSSAGPDAGPEWSRLVALPHESLLAFTPVELIESGDPASS